MKARHLLPVLAAAAVSLPLSATNDEHHEPRHSRRFTNGEAFCV